jgi:hypothetical protein
MAKFKVAEGTQVNVVGVVHKAGEIFEAHPGLVREAVLLGWAIPSDKKVREAPDATVEPK